MNNREVMQQALEALELSTPKARNEDDYAEQGWEEHHAAITALRAALAEPQEPSEMVLVPRELLERASESLGAFVSDHGWAQADMDVMDDIDWTLAASCAHPALQRQPLTDEDLMAAWRTVCERNVTTDELVKTFARVVEFAHGIKGEQK